MTEEYFEADIAILPEWIDGNGHLHDACYSDVFSYCFKDLLDAAGITASFREGQELGTFSLRSHFAYFREVLEGDEIRVRAQVIAVDKKKIHIFGNMFNKSTGDLCASNERLLIHVDLRTRKSIEFSREVQANLEGLVKAHSRLPRPQALGAVIELRQNS